MPPPEHDPDDEPEFCTLCPSTGAPRPPAPEHPPPPPPPPGDAEAATATSPAPADAPDLQWIACHKCETWLHSVCVVSDPDYKAATIPAPLLEQVAASGQGVWFDWPKRVDRWFCKECIDFSASPANPRPPRNPLATTLKKPRTPKAPRTSAAPASTGSPLASKRARLSGPRADKRDSSATPPPPLPPTNGGHGHGNGTAGGEPPAERSRPKRQAAMDRPDYHSLHNHVATPTKQWIELIKDPERYGRVIKDDNFARVPGHILCKGWVESGTSAAGLSVGDSPYPPEFPPTLFYGPTREPMVVHPENGGLASMGGMVPDPSLTVDDVSRLVGPDRMVDVIDVATQTSAQWPLSRWAEYVKARADPHAASSSKVYNIISLEISGTELAQHVRPPRIVNEVDWVENFWPHVKEATMRAAATSVAEDGPAKGMAKSEWPKVQLYCLMGMKDSWTDWHVDFAASSVYYSVHTGSKVFFFIRPTEANLAAYAQWSGSDELQASTWLPDMCDEVRKVTLKAGDTMIIPAGYIHAVFTPLDSIVFGGNFVHSYDISTQLRLRQIEIDTKVPQRFRFPFFDKLCWYVARQYVADLRALREYRPNAKPSDATVPYERILRGLVVLARFLIQQVHTMEDSKTEEKQRRLIWNRIPNEVHDAGALAHELLWRVEQELPDTWEDADEVKVYTEPKGAAKRKGGSGSTGANGHRHGHGSGSSTPAAAAKRAKSLQLLDRPSASRTWKFSPAPWEQDEHPISKSSTRVRRARPGALGRPEEVEEDAEEVTAVYHQSRRRVREHKGETVVEEQDLVFTERRIVWAGPAAETEVKAEEAEPVQPLPQVT